LAQKIFLTTEEYQLIIEEMPSGGKQEEFLHYVPFFVKQPVVCEEVLENNVLFFCVSL
jgi:hypothetical protein